MDLGYLPQAAGAWNDKELLMLWPLCGWGGSETVLNLTYGTVYVILEKHERTRCENGRKPMAKASKGRG